MAPIIFKTKNNFKRSQLYLLEFPGASTLKSTVENSILKYLCMRHWKSIMYAMEH